MQQHIVVCPQKAEIELKQVLRNVLCDNLLMVEFLRAAISFSLSLKRSGTIFFLDSNLFNFSSTSMFQS